MDKSPEHIERIHSFFESILDKDYKKIVLHEAVEALGNLSNEKTLQLVEKFSDEKEGILYETCFLTKRLIDWKLATENGKTEGIDLTKLSCSTNDPAPPYNIKKEP